MNAMMIRPSKAYFLSKKSLYSFGYTKRNNIIFIRTLQNKKLIIILVVIYTWFVLNYNEEKALRKDGFTSPSIALHTYCVKSERRRAPSDFVKDSTMSLMFDLFDNLLFTPVFRVEKKINVRKTTAPKTRYLLYPVSPSLSLSWPSVLVHRRHLDTIFITSVVCKSNQKNIFPVRCHWL